ncbi:sushi, von Willebrand factor type A, EGF and pentraxin domain-containing protein 1-like isoform X2 [Mercenaria mercenaria]|uniref:sushi, von Willebrand factor type A, EGF and pentraxin domain-containing protein 1-like isoform X2 n=1 Tax=Mercenaria mercenaria TaxID=6596 RepID=UPI00234ED360|nr:sushi, von Willebrand factor type A, EGF and pentraxin domain-containing protein 1-like isoform X2 [Mercenaria mercenaria]
MKDEYSPCEGCSDNGEFSIDQKCGNSGYPLPEKTPERAVLHGNMFSVGSKISYQCYEGYAMNSTDISISTCEAGGAWGLTNFKCLPEVAFTADVLRSDDTYYMLVRNKYTWDEAKSNCECLGGYLADIKSQQEQDVIEKLFFWY